MEVSLPHLKEKLYLFNHSVQFESDCNALGCANTFVLGFVFVFQKKERTQKGHKP